MHPATIPQPFARQIMLTRHWAFSAAETSFRIEGYDDHHFSLDGVHPSAESKNFFSPSDIHPGKRSSVCVWTSLWRSPICRPNPSRLRQSRLRGEMYRGGFRRREIARRESLFHSRERLQNFWGRGLRQGRGQQRAVRQFLRSPPSLPAPGGAFS